MYNSICNSSRRNEILYSLTSISTKTKTAFYVLTYTVLEFIHLQNRTISQTFKKIIYSSRIRSTQTGLRLKS